MRRRALFGLLALTLGGLCAGCSSSPNGEEPGYSKSDFAKRPPPPGYGPPKGFAPAQPPSK